MSATLTPDLGTRHGEEPPIGRVLRAGLLALAGVGVAGTAVELATIRHWDSAEQLIPWAVLAVLALAIGLVAVRPTGVRVRAGRLLGLATGLGGAYGVWEHIEANLHAGPLDATYGPRWDAMSPIAQWWAAATGGVGPSPTLAPAILTQIGLTLLLATVAHPALARRATTPNGEPGLP